MPLDSLIEFITILIADYLYAGVFLAALIETIIPPIPTMAVFPTAGFIASQNGLELPELFLLGIIGGLGAALGSTVIYLIALKLGRTVLLKYLKYVKVSEKKLLKVESWFQKYGDKAVLFGRMVPVFREMISVPAGLLKMKFLKFIVYTVLIYSSKFIILITLSFVVGCKYSEIFSFFSGKSLKIAASNSFEL